MCRCSSAILWLVLVACASAAWSAAAQEVDGVDASPDARIEEFVERDGLERLHAVLLRERLASAPAEERAAIAERLAGLYARMLEEAETKEERREIERLGTDLLRIVPDAESAELRITLAKAQYLSAEEVAERHRLRLASAVEREEAERTLRVLSSTFEEIGSKVHRRVDVLERRESSGRADVGEVRAELADARRLRSLAMYYAGWSTYYLGVVSDAPAQAREALESFGWLLGAPRGGPPTIEQLPERLLRFEHVARAAMGAALCESLRGQDVRAVRWLDVLDAQADLPRSVRKQLFSRRLLVYGASKRWADLKWMMQRRRGTAGAELDVRDARLVAVLALEAIDSEDSFEGRRDLAGELARDAMRELIEQGAIDHVLDLVQRYGTAPIGREGFVVRYVRGLRDYELAREAQQRAGESTDEPANAPAVANRFREAAELLRAAFEADDASDFAKQRDRCGVLLGLSLFYSGAVERAADVFERVAKTAVNEDAKDDGLWFAIVALDRAVEGRRPSLAPRRDRLATLYLESFPRGERAAKLLIRRAASDLIDDREAAEVLLSVPPTSALYQTARRHASRLLYRVYRRERGPKRDFAALRFVEVAEEALGFDRAQMMSEDDEARSTGRQFAILRVRQMLDALLGMSSPDLARASRAIERLESMAAETGVDLSDIEAELTYRKLQIALGAGRMEEAERLLGDLEASGGRFAESARRLLYTRALREWVMDRDAPPLAEQVVRQGVRVIADIGGSDEAMARPEVVSLHATVAEAASVVWRERADERMRDLALEYDALLMERGHRSEEVLRRFASLSEGAGDLESALEAWRLLLAAREPGAESWFEPRYETIRLLLAVDPPRAKQAMEQHAVLYPEYGPEPWGEKLRELQVRVRLAPGGAPPDGAPASEGAG